MKKLLIFIILLIVLAAMGWQKGWFESASQGPGDTAAFSSENFSLDYPKDFKTREEEVGNGVKRHVFESSKAREGFEIVVLPFDEAGPLTRERILQDLPDMVINITPRPPLILRGGGGEAIPTLAFESVDEGLGPTFEVWFVSGGNLYEARTYPEFGQQMEEILKTFK